MFHPSACWWRWPFGDERLGSCTTLRLRWRMSICLAFGGCVGWETPGWVVGFHLYGWARWSCMPRSSVHPSFYQCGSRGKTQLGVWVWVFFERMMAMQLFMVNFFQNQFWKIKLSEVWGRKSFLTTLDMVLEATLEGEAIVPKIWLNFELLSLWKATFYVSFNLHLLYLIPSHTDFSRLFQERCNFYLLNVPETNRLPPRGRTLSVLDSPFSHFFQPENLQRLDSEFTLLAQVGFF